MHKAGAQTFLHLKWFAVSEGSKCRGVGFTCKGRKEGKGKIMTNGKKLSPNDEAPSDIRQVWGTGNLLFVFHEIIQKWIIARAQEALETHWASREQINSLYSMCMCKNKEKQNIQRRWGTDVWQLIPFSDIYLPVALFSNLLNTPCSCWFYLLCSAFQRSETNKEEGRNSSHIPEDLIYTVGMCSADTWATAFHNQCLTCHYQMMNLAYMLSELLQATSDCFPHHKWDIDLPPILHGNLFCSLLWVCLWGQQSYFMLTICCLSLQQRLF